MRRHSDLEAVVKLEETMRRMTLRERLTRLQEVCASIRIVAARTQKCRPRGSR